MSDPGYHVDRLQAEVQEIAEVLQREQPDKTIAELWGEALSLHRVRYEREVRPPKHPRSGTRRRHAEVIQWPDVP